MKFSSRPLLPFTSLYLNYPLIPYPILPPLYSITSITFHDINIDIDMAMDTAVASVTVDEKLFSLQVAVTTEDGIPFVPALEDLIISAERGILKPVSEEGRKGGCDPAFFSFELSYFFHLCTLDHLYLISFSSSSIHIFFL